MGIQTVAITGGNGRIGGQILNELNSHGYNTVNLNRGKRKSRVVSDDDSGADQYIQTQMLDPGNVYGSLAKSDADAVVHMASIPNPLSNVGYETYESNVMSTYHILEAASQLELETAIVPSSVNVVGGPFQEPPMDIKYLPVDEEHPVSPRDPYSIAKHAIEVTADGFGRQQRYPSAIVSLRFPWIATTEELQTTFSESDRSLTAVTKESAGFARDNLFSYLHLQDAGGIVRAILESDFEGHERFWAVAEDTTTSAPTRELIASCYPETTVKKEFHDRESLISTAKAKRMLDWQPTKSWR